MRPHLGDQTLDPSFCFGISGETLLLWILIHTNAEGTVKDSDGRESGVQKNAGLKAATLISVSNPVSQVLW